MDETIKKLADSFEAILKADKCYEETLELLLKSVRETVSQIEPPVINTLQKRFEIYETAINEIQDFLEYSYKTWDRVGMKQVIMKSIDKIADRLRDL